MLYSQIPQGMLENIAGKLTIDLKLIKTELSESPKEKSLHAKLQIIEKFLKDAEKVGDTNTPKSYFCGTENMKMASYPSGLVYFGTYDKVIIGLGGSSSHVIGNVGDGHAHSHSATPYLVAALNEQLEAENRHLLGRENSESMALAGVELASSQMSGITQKMEFLAKTIVHYPSDTFEYTWGFRSGKPVILGSPLFVAQID